MASQKCDACGQKNGFWKGQITLGNLLIAVPLIGYCFGWWGQDAVTKDTVKRLDAAIPAMQAQIQQTHEDVAVIKSQVQSLHDREISRRIVPTKRDP